MSEERIFGQLAQELGLRPAQIKNTVALLDEGNTVPFIARYRKEATDEMKDEQIRALQERLQVLRNLEGRKAEVTRLIGEQGKLTEELAAAIAAAKTVTDVEDLYRPYRPKRRTRAMIAREKGLEPLADLLLDPAARGTPEQAAEPFLSEQVPTVAEALAGARDIIAERVSDDPEVRRIARDLTTREGGITSKMTGEGGEKAQEFEMYADFGEAVAKVAPHRVLALNRGEKLGVLSVDIAAPDDRIVTRMKAMYVRRSGTAFSAQIEEAVADAYKRLVAPAIEREVRAALGEKAEERAIHVFSENLGNLLLQAPIAGHTVMGVDPGFRTGCKVAVVDATGKVLDTGTVYITAASQTQIAAGEALLLELINRHQVSVLSIGNGTASRETEQVVARLIPQCKHPVHYLITNEAGASVYSASKLGAAEFPQYDVSIRGAISIARRVQDPLAELVKIEPKHIGVGQYQHDVDQKRLESQLDAVVETAVNAVGVDLNTASPALLGYVAGIKSNVARAVVEYREANGRFKSRAELKKVSGLGEKAFVQCAGFLRIADGSNPLDNTPVHPESYHVAEAILKAVGTTRKELVTGKGNPGLRLALAQIKPEQVAAEMGVGVPTVKDILNALQKPGRDPREDLPQPVLRTDVLELKDLAPGMELTGTVRNVVDFGAFVDIGVHQDGLVHISQISQKFIKHPSEAVAVGDVVKVRVLEVDHRRNRIALTMKL